MSIGSRIKELRVKKGITQEELAQKIGVTKGAIGNYENEVSSPKIELMYKLFDVLDCDANYLHQDDMKKSIYKDTATPEEFEKLVKPYRSLDPHGQQTVDIILDREVERSNQLLEVQEKITELEAQATAPNIINPMVKESTPDYLEPNAAHADDYAHAPIELKKLEEDIMDDENF